MVSNRVRFLVAAVVDNEASATVRAAKRGQRPERGKVSGGGS